MGNLLKTIFSALRHWDDTERRVHESDRESESRYVASPLPRHRISLTATASFGFSGIPEEIRIRDINEKGLYFYTNLDMPIGATLDIVAVLPPDITADGKGRRVHYEAKVARVEREQDKGQYGVGASIRRCETFPLPITTSPKKPAAPNRAPAPALKSIQPTKTAEENIQPAPKTLAPLRIPKVVEPPIPKTITPLRFPKIAEPAKDTPAPVPIQKIAAPIEEFSASVEETIAHRDDTVPLAPPVVADDSASADQNRFAAKTRNQVIIEKLATTALRAGISIEELIRLVDCGLTPAELVDVIEARLMVRVQ